MEFNFSVADENNLKDSEIVELLHQVYVEGGYSTEEQAKTLFEPSSVRSRGQLLIARSAEQGELVGMVILVTPESGGRKLAEGNDVEMHLLAVNKQYRGSGIGTELVNRIVEMARNQQFSNILLWTQSSMESAQSLYKQAGFHQIDTMKRNGREFFVYQLAL